MTRSQRSLELSVLPEQFVIVRLPREAALPTWATQGELFSVTRTADELSLVCAARYVPENLRGQGRWRALKVHGPFALTEVGVLASLAAPLADARISMFAVSTFDTDYLLVNEMQLGEAMQTLRRAGHRIADTAAAS